MKMQLKSISIDNSPFFADGTKIEFSDKLNCLMGGRGTGKSTLLYFIWCALSDKPEEASTVSTLLRANLYSGTITLNVQGANGKEFIVTKTLGVEPLITSGGANETITIEELRNYFDPEFYPALKIEDIGRNPVDRLNLIDRRIYSKVDEIRQQMRDGKISLDHNARTIRTENARLSECSDRLKDYSTAKADLSSHRKNKPVDLSEVEQKSIEQLDDADKIRNAEKRYKRNVVNRLEETLLKIGELEDHVTKSKKLNDAVSTFSNSDILSEVAKEFEAVLSKVHETAGHLRDVINASLGKVEVIAGPLEEKHRKQQTDATELKQKLSQHQEYISKYDSLSKRVEELKLLKEEIDDIEERRKKGDVERKGLLTEFNNRKKELFNLRKSTVDTLNTELGEHVRITLTFGGLTENYENLLRNSLKGSNLRYNTIIPYIVENFTPDRFAAAIHSKDANELCKISAIDSERSAALISALHESPDIYEIETLYVEDLPEFYLKVERREVDGGISKADFKKSDELSTGQRCTAVLPIIFAVSDNPLIIDQPEDNLDNDFINKAVRKIIQSQKANRQLIFITHNPNIPVVSEAEFNIFLHYEDGASKVKISGTVDAVKEEIVHLLEGGEEAFVTRQELYDLRAKKS